MFRLKIIKVLRIDPPEDIKIHTYLSLPFIPISGMIIVGEHENFLIGSPLRFDLKTKEFYFYAYESGSWVTRDEYLQLGWSEGDGND